jgi:drug/metabolite transporter (DMT)-like permease
LQHKNKFALTALLLAIFLNAYIGVAFSIFKKFQVDLFQTIVFNYWICVITGMLVLGYSPVGMETFHADWFPYAILMGVLFIGLFNMIAISSVKVGVTITQTANKLSFVIPVIFAVLAYHESAKGYKLLGIIIALLAVVLTTYTKKDNTAIKPSRWEYALPILLFVGSGILDTLTNFVQHTFLTSEAISNAYLIMGFMVAAITGSLVLLYLFLTGKKTWHWKNVVAGIILGVPNYFSIFFLVQALKHSPVTSSATLPINNIGVLFVVSIFGILVLKEKLRAWNYVGLVLTLLSIILIYLGDIA